MNKVTLILLSLIFLNSGTSGQKAPIKFGDVSMDEVKMTTFTPDTTAPAVILCDYGYFRSNTRLFTRTLRIKILKKEGYIWANQKFESDFKSSLKGIITNIEDGKIVQEKLKNEYIYKTRVYEDINILSVAVPDVKVGSVIDFEFIINGIPSEWRFQEEIPVIYSELILEESSEIRLQKNFYGYEPISSFTPTRWIARNMPAFKKEPIMNSAENFLTKLELDFLQIRDFQINTDWYEVNRILLDYTNFGLQGLNTSFLNEITRQLSDRYKNREDLLRTAFDTVRQKVYWNESARLMMADPNLATVFKKGVGNSAEINVILLKLLDKLGFEVYPIAIRTRDEGALAVQFPSLRQLNYFIVYTKIGEKEYLLDATEKYLPYYLLPLRCLNGQGRLIDKQKDLWIPLTCSKKRRSISIYDLDLTNDLSLKGTATLSRYDYSALDYRKKYYEFNSLDEYKEYCLKTMPGLNILDFKIDNLDSIYKPVVEKRTVEIKAQVSQSDNNLYIVPANFEEIKENPFKLNVRKYPVDYGILSDETLILNFRIPDGYTLVSLPKSVNLKLKDNAASYMYQAVKFDNNLKITAKFTVNKAVFMTNEYNDLREFYNQILNKISEAIILKNKESL